MQTQSTYRKDYHPAFPALDVILANVEDGLRSGPLSALLDSGADGTLVPISYLKDLLAVPLRDVSIRSHWGELRKVQLFTIDLELADLRLPGIFVIGDEQENEIVLGRNVLNRLVVVLDGPGESVTLR